MCFYLVGDGQVKRSKNKQKGVKRSKIGQVIRACRGMRPSSQKLEAGMPQHAMAGHAAACQIMPLHDDADRTRLFLASRVLGLLCNTTFFVSIKRK